MRVGENIFRLLLVSMLALVFTACNGKSKSETNTTADSNVTAEQNTTTGGSDNNTTGGNDDNTSISPTVTLTSLNLTVDKTTLNRDENTTIKVEVTYSDNSTKDVTDKVEWVVVPSDAVKVTIATLTAVQDRTTTVKAKLNTTLSNTENLDIIWTVNGYTLPPEPDKALNDSTLLGIDANDNDVRDDVERWIYETYKDKHPIHIDIAMQAARGYKKVLQTPEKAKEIRDKVNASIYCQSYYSKTCALRSNRIILVNEDIDEKIFIRFFNTKERKDTYWRYDKLLSGDTYIIPWCSERKILCDFNTTKHEEK